MNGQNLPIDLIKVVGGENIDFSVKAKRKQPLKKSLGIILFGTFWTSFVSIFVIAFFGPIYRSEKYFESSVDLVPALMIILFLLIGVGMLAWGFISIFQTGGFFMGTSTRLIQYNKGTIKTTDWEQFSGNIEINSKNGNITLQLRTGKMVSSKNSPDRYVPDVIDISGIPDVFEIEKICRIRIKENDPTPQNASLS